MICGVPLGEVAHISMGSAPPSSSYNEDGLGFPMIAGAGDYGELHPKPKKWTTEPSRVTQLGDLIVCVRATIGDLNWADREYCLGRGVAGLRAKEDKLDIRYAAHFIKSKRNELLKLGTGSTFLAIRRADLEEFKIPLPPLPEQCRIAAILDKANAIRHKRQQAIRLTEEFLRSVFLDMFGDPVTNPKGWDSWKLGKLIENGPQNGLYKHASDYGSGTQIIRIDSFYDGVVTGMSDLKRVRLDKKSQEKYSVQKDDILINRVNSRKYLGKCAIVPGLTEPTVFESNMMRFGLKKDVLDPIYLVALLQHEYIRRQILNCAKDAVNQSSINQADVNSFEVRVPPIELQMKFVVAKNKISDMMGAFDRSSGRQNILFNSLVQRAFRGDL